MKTLLGTALINLSLVAPALAADGGLVKGTSLLIILFLGFAALIIVFQFLPGLVLFYSMLKGLFKRAEKNGADTKEK
ncbi:MAG TPA: hypothetical protein VF799_05135 [Geobacteraceae bacterium]